MASKEDVREFVYDAKTKTKYLQGRFLGKGGFAKCYEFVNARTKVNFAGKVVSKSMLTKEQQKEKMSQEITIHRSLSHSYIVGFHSYFEDDKNVYIILELCRKRSLMEMHKRRRALTEPEVRYFMRQIVHACIYLHSNKVIHRDLKLGNLFINDDMDCKVGDFGLATRVGFDGERKKTLCGTPNYIAPEILNKRGHSFEVDVWSLGCIMYTLLVGTPPFETHTLKETYTKIKKNDYHIPSRIGKSARILIQKMLRSEPSTRPNMEEILSDDFFLLGYLPQRLPTSCLTMPPRFTAKVNSELASNSVNTRKPLLEINKDSPIACASVKPSTEIVTAVEKGDLEVFTNLNLANNEQENQKLSFEVPSDYYLGDLYQMLKSVVECIPNVANGQYDEAQDPAAVPFIWISKWVDYTDKYGLGYQLCDNSVGVLFNDSTRLILLADGQNFHYIERGGGESYHDMQNHPSALDKKVTLLKYFHTYMSDNLLKAGDTAKPREGDELTQVPHLRAWFRTRSAMIFHLTNGTLQVNFFEDHTKIILCPLMGAVSYIDERKEFSVFRMKLIEKYGCSPTLASRLQYAKLMVEKLSSCQLVAGKALNFKSSKSDVRRNRQEIETK